MGSMSQIMDPAGWWAIISSGWSDIGHTEFWVALVKIMWINILLSGDNAVVIAMACRGLPHGQRIWGMILGAGVAVGLRIIFTGVVASLMTLPYLKIVGGLALFYIAAKLLVPDDPDKGEAEAAEHLWRAVRIVAIADIIMSLADRQLRETARTWLPLRKLGASVSGEPPARFEAPVFCRELRLLPFAV